MPGLGGPTVQLNIHGEDEWGHRRVPSTMQRKQSWASAQLKQRGASREKWQSQHFISRPFSGHLQPESRVTARGKPT